MTATLEALKADLLRELRCRPAGQSVPITALVEDYGPQTHAALLALRRERVVRLVAAGIADEVPEYGKIEGSDGKEVFIEAELRQ